MRLNWKTLRLGLAPSLLLLAPCTSYCFELVNGSYTTSAGGTSGGNSPTLSESHVNALSTYQSLPHPSVNPSYNAQAIAAAGFSSPPPPPIIFINDDLLLQSAQAPWATANGSASKDGGGMPSDSGFSASSTLTYYMQPTSSGPSSFSAKAKGFVYANVSSNFFGATALVIVERASEQGGTTGWTPIPGLTFQAKCRQRQEIGTPGTPACATGSTLVDFDTRFTVTAGFNYRITLVAAGLGTLFVTEGNSSSMIESGSFGAYADPYFYIPDDQANASQFSLVFSPNVSNLPAVPELPTLLLICAGLGAIGITKKKRAIR